MYFLRLLPLLGIFYLATPSQACFPSIPSSGAASPSSSASSSTIDCYFNLPTISLLSTSAACGGVPTLSTSTFITFAGASLTITCNSASPTCATTFLINGGNTPADSACGMTAGQTCSITLTCNGKSGILEVDGQTLTSLKCESVVPVP